MPIGIEMLRTARAMLAQCFYLNKLTLPQRAPEMTAYEVGQRVQEYIRGALPLFEPMEMDYNGGAVRGDLRDPDARERLRPDHQHPEVPAGARHQFHFESPLHDAIATRTSRWAGSSSAT
jgi:hypothetical protein